MGRTGGRGNGGDEAEGADILMVKPAGMYLDVTARVRDSTPLPVAAPDR